MVCPRKDFTLAARPTARRNALSRAMVGDSAATPRELNCKLVLVTHPPSWPRARAEQVPVTGKSLSQRLSAIRGTLFSRKQVVVLDVEAGRREVKAAVAVLFILLVSVSPSSGQLDDSEESEESLLTVGPRPSSVAKKVVSLGLILAGAAAVVVGDPDYTPPQFIPGNYPNRVDIRGYLPHGNYTGHTYRLQRRRGPRYGHRWSCRNPSCSITDERLYDNYINGYTDGYDDGHFAGRVEGHRKGWAQGYSRGQADVVRIMNAEGMVIYDGPFDPASYVKETFKDRKQWRHTGVALVVAGAVLNLLWPEGTRRVQGSLLHGGGQIGAALEW